MYQQGFRDQIASIKGFSISLFQTPTAFFPYAPAQDDGLDSMRSRFRMRPDLLRRYYKSHQIKKGSRAYDT